MRKIIPWKGFLNRSPCSNRVNIHPTRPSSSSTHNDKPTAINNSNDSFNNGSSSSPSSLSSYSEQYKALNNLDFMTAAKIIFSDPPKKKNFGLDFHLVQLFFVCLPSLAVYLVAQYARSEMRKMDAELEKKKQAEFEAQAKEMELKAAEEKAAVASNPELLEMKERLNKLEVAVKKFVVESKKQNQAANVKPDDSENGSVSHGKMSGPGNQEAKK